MTLRGRLCNKGSAPASPINIPCGWFTVCREPNTFVDFVAIKFCRFFLLLLMIYGIL